MPETKEKAKLLATKEFSNRNYSIKITLYDHQMAYADIRDKLRWRRRHRKDRPRMSFIYFDECTSESMYDYFDCLDTLRYDKVARRWFMRQMRHCTAGLLLPDGRQDYEKVYGRMYANWHKTANSYNYSFKDGRKALPPESLDKLLRLLPGAAYDKYICATYVCEGDEDTVLKVGEGCFTRTIGRPESFRLRLIEEVLPEFYAKVRRERALDNCTISITVTWLTPADCDLAVVVQDNDYVSYTID